MRLLLAMAFAMSAASVSYAHQSGPPAPGLAIPSLGHGQMAVVAGHRAAILDLARTQAPVDQIVQRLLNHARIQHASCLWGMMPGSISDETSPFNACSHADLAAAVAILSRLEALSAAAAHTRALRRAIDADMIAAGTASELCAYSGTGFSTGAVIGPVWAALPSHGPSLAVAAAMGLAVAGAPLLLRRRRRA